MKRDILPFGLRMPDELRAALTAQAKENGRSLTAEIVFRLEKSLEFETKVYDFECGNPLDIILSANTAIAHYQHEIAIALETLKTGFGVAEPKPSYKTLLSMLSETDQQTLELVSSLPEQARESLINLIKQTTGRGKE